MVNLIALLLGIGVLVVCLAVSVQVQNRTVRLIAVVGAILTFILIVLAWYASANPGVYLFGRPI